MKNPKISIVIGTLNQCNVLKTVLPYYENVNTSLNDFEVIVVDSTSNDGSIDFLKQYKPKFQFKYHIQKNNGKASARNKAASMAQGEILIITDADMIPDKQFIQGHIEAHGNLEKMACYEGLAWDMKRLSVSPDPNELSPQVGTHPKHLSKLGWYYFLTGNLSIPKILFEKEGGFNELFKGYGWEDLELGYRLFKQKIPLYYLKTSVNFHYHVISTENKFERNVLKGSSARIFLKLHPELKWFLGLNPLSRFIFPKIKQSSFFFRWVENTCYKSKFRLLDSFGRWFLGEYYYLKGILNN